MRTVAGTVAGMGRTSRSRFEGYVPLEHPLRRVRSVIDVPPGALQHWPRSVYTPGVRSPIAPEPAIRALLLQFLFMFRRDRQLIEQIWTSLLFRWFVGVRLDDAPWDPDAFSACREQLLRQDMVRDLLLRGLAEAHGQGLLSGEALTARRCDLAQYASEVTRGIGHPGVLPAATAPAAPSKGPVPA
jgi:transposase